MTTPSSTDDALRAALEQHAANMSAAEFRAFTYRVRPPGETSPLQPADPADRMRAITNGIAAKQAKRPAVDHNGHPLRETGTPK